MTIIRGIRARLRRRLLLSYRLDPDVARGLLPEGLRPLLVDGYAVAGVCVLGLEDIRPRWARGSWGLRSENAAHRIAVEWDGGGEIRRGVYIFTRHSSAWLPVLFGGRVFPGVHRKARFAIEESAGRYAVTMDGAGESLAVDVEIGGEWESGLFRTIEDASEFYRSGRIGWSRRQARRAQPRTRGAHVTGMGNRGRAPAESAIVFLRCAPGGGRRIRQRGGDAGSAHRDDGDERASTADPVR